MERMRHRDTPAYLRTGLRAYLAALLFIAPLKFGSVIESGGISDVPVSVWDWAFATWAPFAFPAFCGVALAWAASVYRPPALRVPSLLLPGAWLVLFLSLAPGLIRTTEWDAASLLLFHLLGAACLSLAVYWALEAGDQQLRAWLLVGVSAGLAWSAAQGWMQTVGGGLARAEAFALEDAKRRGATLPVDLLCRLQQRRAFADFTIANSYAAHLVLVGPPFLYALWRAGNRVEPVRVSRWLFPGLGVALAGGALVLSQSRAAMLALGGGTAVAIFMHPRLQRRRVPLAMGFMAVTVSAFAALTWVRPGSKFSSLQARVGYCRAAVGMLAAHPVTGIGLGEFQSHFLRVKPAGAEEARHPHNLLLSMAAQSGVAGGAAAALCLALPLALGPVLRRRRGAGDDGLVFLVRTGLASWCLHSLTDFNLLVPGTLGTAAILPLLALDVPPDQEGGVPRRGRAVARAVAGTLAAGALASLWRYPGELAYARQTRLLQHGADTSVVHAQATHVARLLPLSPYPWSTLGRLAWQRGQFGLAQRAYREAVSRAPHRSVFRRHLAEALVALGELGHAREHARAAVTWYGTDPKARELAERLGVLPP